MFRIANFFNVNSTSISSKPVPRCTRPYYPAQAAIKYLSTSTTQPRSLRLPTLAMLGIGSAAVGYVFKTEQAYIKACQELGFDRTIGYREDCNGDRTYFGTDNSGLFFVDGSMYVAITKQQVIERAKKIKEGRQYHQNLQEKFDHWLRNLSDNELIDALDQERKISEAVELFAIDGVYDLRRNDPFQLIPQKKERLEKECLNRGILIG